MTATGGTNQAGVTWTAANGNGSTITGYVVTAVAGTSAANSVATDGSATSATLSGLAGGTAYTVQVAAVSGCGTGPAGASSAVTPTGPAATYASQMIADAPAAYWRLGEPSGTLAADSSGHGGLLGYDTSNVTLGVTGAITGDPDTAVSSNGCCGGTAQGTVPALPQFNDARTVLAWVNFGASGNGGYVASWGNGNTAQAFSLYAGPGGISAITSSNDRSFTLSHALNDGAWHQVAITYDGTSVQAYLDGQAQGAAVQFAQPLDTQGTGFYLGSYFGGGSFTGSLDDVAVFGKALTATQISALFAASGYGRPSAPRVVHAFSGRPNEATVTWGISTAKNAPVTGYLVTAYIGTSAANSVAVAGDKTAARLSGLAGGTPYTFTVVARDAYGSGTAGASNVVTPGGSAAYASQVIADGPAAYWRLGDPSGTVAADSSGHGALLSYDTANATIGVAGAIVGDPDTAVASNGCCGGTAQGNAPALPQFNSARTVLAWVNLGTSGSGGYVASWGNGNTAQAFSLYAAPTQISVITSSNDQAFTLSHSLSDGAWHQVAISYDGTSVRAYLDGQMQGAARQLSQSLNTQGTGFYLGSYFGGGGFTGSLDDVAVFGKALTTAQIGTLFTASGYARPSAPASVTATGGANKAAISWHPATAPAATITSYQVTAYSGTTPVNSVATDGSATSVTLSGLAGGSSYTVKVVAQDAYGTGSPGTSNAVTPAGSATYASQVIADGPAAYWRLGEPSGTLAADSSGHGALLSYNTANVTLGVAGAILGDPDTAVASNGCCNGTAQGSVTALPQFNGARTIVAWVNLGASGNGGYIASWGNGNTAKAFSLYAAPTQISVITSNNDRSFTPSHALNDGAWHQVAITYDGTSVQAYLDGQAQGPAVQFGQSLDTQGTVFYLGSYFGGGGFTGNLDDVAVFGKALTTAQVGALFTASGYGPPSAPASVTATGGANKAAISWHPAIAPAVAVTSYQVTAYSGTTPVNSVATNGTATSATLSGLAGGTSYTFKVVAQDSYGTGAPGTSNAVTPTGPAGTYASQVIADGPAAYWRLGESSGTLAADSSGHGALLSYNTANATLGVAGAIAGDPDTAVASNGCCNGTAQGNVTALPQFNDTRTIVAWVNLGGSGNGGYVASWGNGNTAQAFSLYAGPGSISAVTAGNDQSFTLSHALNDGAWHQVAITYDGTSVRAYLDGQMQGTARQFGQSLDTQGTRFYLGSFFGGGGFTGSLDDVAVFGKALTTTQIGTLFTASGYGRPSAPGSVTATGGANKAAISWQPATAPATAVTGYLVTAYSGTTPVNSVATGGSATSATLSGLAGGTSYTFKVVAQDAYGFGAPGTSNAVTPTGPATTYASQVIADGPAAYWRLGEPSGTLAADSSGHGAPLGYDPSNVTLGVAGGITGDPDTAIASNGCCGGAAQGTVPALPQFNGARTIVAWINLGSSGGGGGYVASWGNPNTAQAFSLYAVPTQISVVTSSNDLSFTPPQSLGDGAWHEVAATYNGSQVTVYVDGTMVGSPAPFGQSLNTRGTGFYLGSYFNSGGFSGDLDEVAVFGKALTAAQIASLRTTAGYARARHPSRTRTGSRSRKGGSSR